MAGLFFDYFDGYLRVEFRSGPWSGDIEILFHVSREHLHRYMTEFEFRYNNRHVEDSERTLLAIKASEGKRLMYKEPESRDQG